LAADPAQGIGRLALAARPSFILRRHWLPEFC
jgi:hypothetical protein